MEDSAQILTKLHQTYLENLTPDLQLDYLMDSSCFLQSMNLTGWIERFQPACPTKAKKTRGAPGAYVWKQLPPCRACKSSEVIEDVPQGCVVCTACGLIQDTYAMGVTPAHISMNGLTEGSRYAVHRYSRLVYFRSLLQIYQGENQHRIPAELIVSIRKNIDETRACVGPVTPSIVRRSIRSLRLPSKYRKFAAVIACELSGKSNKQLTIGGPLLLEMFRIFRQIEYHWDHGACKRSKKGRKSFMSYNYIFWQLCHHFDCMEFASTDLLLKSKRLLKRQHMFMRIIANLCQLNVDLDVYNDDRH